MNVILQAEEPIYWLKQASRQWHVKFDRVIISFRCVDNVIDQCIYLEICGNKFIVLAFYVEDILLASSDKFTQKTECLLFKNFEMKDLS